MSTYGRYDVTRYPNHYAVTDVVEHKVVFETKTDSASAREQAHRKARELDAASKAAARVQDVRE